ncbi:hypothetical protein D3C71_1973880 [compost metagenome]
MASCSRSDTLDDTRCDLSSKVKNQNSTAVTNRIAENTLGTICQLAAAMIAGARNLVSAEPALPAPKMPMARPWLDVSNHLAT